jgi:hypothetical protein
LPINNVISPFTDSRAASVAPISAAVPRRNSSWILVSSQYFLDSRQRLHDAMRRFVKNQRGGFIAKRLQRAQSLARLSR